MEKELFVTTLKSKAGVDNLSDRTIDEVAALFLPSFADDTKVTDESWAIPVQMLKTMSGQLRHDMSSGITAFKTQYEADNKAAQMKAIEDAVSAAKAEWEKANPKQEPQPSEAKDIDKKIADSIAKAMEGLTGEEGAIGKLSKQFGEYMAAVAAEKKAQSEADIRGRVREYLLSRGVDEDDFALEYTLERMTIGEKPNIDELSKQAEKDYEANYKKIHKNEGGQPFGGGFGSADGNDGGGAKAWLKGREGSAEQEAAAAEARKKLLK